MRLHELRAQDLAHALGMDVEDLYATKGVSIARRYERDCLMPALQQMTAMTVKVEPVVPILMRVCVIVMMRQASV